MKKVDVVIVGGGILAWVLAQRISRLSSISSAIIISSREFHTASLHNQSWLQSGLLYNLDNAKENEVAELCMFHGRKLMELQNAKMERQSAIMAVSSKAEAEKKIAFMQKYGYRYANPYLGNNEARDRLGNDFFNSPCYSDDTRFIWTPDQPFDEGGLLRFCEDSLSFSNFRFSSLKGSAVLIRNSQASNGYSIKLENEEFDPAVLFVLTGLNTGRFLQPLGLEKNIDINARRCVLMKIPQPLGLKTSIFINKINNTNINTVGDLAGNKIHLLGDSLFSTVPNIYELPNDKLVTATDKENFINNFCEQDGYPDLLDKIKPYAENDANFSVCYKTESSAYLPWIYNSNSFESGFKNIHIAGPGKATLAFHTATELLRNANFVEGNGQNVHRNEKGNSGIKMWFEVNQET